MDLTLSENKKFLIIDSCTEAEYKQLKLSLTKKIEGWRFHPLVKKGLWDGTICFLKGSRIPSGLWKEVKDICEEFKFEYNVKGLKNLFNINIDKEDFILWCDDFFNDLPYKPRYYQIDAAYKIIKYRRCLAELATSAGKTLISYIVIAYLLKELQYKKILMIVPNVNLVLQSSGDFEEYNNDKLNLKIQQVYAGAKVKNESNIVVGTFQSLVKMEQEFYDQFDIVFVDECLHPDTKILMADNTEKCIKDVNIGDKVYTFNEKTQTKEINEVEYVYKNLSKSDILYEVELEDGTILKLTPNHKVLLTNGIYKRADELLDTDDILIF